MADTKTLTFAVAVNDRRILRENLLDSPCFDGHHGHQIIVQEHFGSAADAYNDAIERSENDIIVCLHQDIMLPAGWPHQVSAAVELLESKDPNWGVLGCYGVTVTNEAFGYVYSFRLLGEPLPVPQRVQTLDEIVLVLRKGSGLRFNLEVANYHFYGADICMSAFARGMNCYAISALCIHNAQERFVLPKEFYASYRNFKNLWKEYLPVQTTCIRVTRYDIPMYRRKLTEFYLEHVSGKVNGARRLAKPLDLLHRLVPGSDIVAVPPTDHTKSV